MSFVGPRDTIRLQPVFGVREVFNFLRISRVGMELAVILWDRIGLGQGMLIGREPLDASVGRAILGNLLIHQLVVAAQLVEVSQSLLLHRVEADVLLLASYRPVGTSTRDNLLVLRLMEVLFECLP